MHDDYDVETEHGGKDPEWRTKDGRKIRVSAMTDQHVLNTARFCRRQSASLMRDSFRAGAYASTAPDGAAMAAESEANAAMDQAFAYLAWAAYLEKVAKARGLTLLEERKSVLPFLDPEDEATEGK